MDNFMDKLSNRFHAGELIRANGEAEAKQMQTLKEQNEQQNELLSEIRRLNLKTVEISEQISQMASLSIEKLEEFSAPAAKAPSEETKSAQPENGWELEMYQGMSQLHTELQNIERLETSLLAFQETQTEHNGQLAEMMKQTMDAQGKPTSWQTEVWQSMSMMQQQLQNLEQMASSQVALQEQLQSAQAQFLDQVEEERRDNQERQTQHYDRILDKMEKDLKMPEKPRFVYEIEASLSEIENNAANGKREIISSVERLKNDLADSLSKEDKQADQGALIKELNALLLEQSKKTADALAQIKELVVGLRVYMDEVEKKAEDFVHKEDVKVYRNVQAVVMETVSARNRDVIERVESIDKRVEKQKGIKGLLILTCLLSLASLGVSVVQMLGLFG
ncbi:MAG: hypothetical protein K5739_09320 [Lachnospiraceae bacterium]|nr:hypothetical protein [Lachnospiraceae bacterium]